jgi:hypothetical protein
MFYLVVHLPQVQQQQVLSNEHFAVFH